MTVKFENFLLPSILVSSRCAELGYLEETYVFNVFLLRKMVKKPPVNQPITFQFAGSSTFISMLAFNTQDLQTLRIGQSYNPSLVLFHLLFQ